MELQVHKLCKIKQSTLIYQLLTCCELVIITNQAVEMVAPLVWTNW
jgi:hypothetical protein